MYDKQSLNLKANLFLHSMPNFIINYVSFIKVQTDYFVSIGNFLIWLKEIVNAITINHSLLAPNGNFKYFYS